LTCTGDNSHSKTCRHSAHQVGGITPEWWARSCRNEWAASSESADGTLAFTDEGIQEVRLLLAEHRRITRAPD
jgi:hypothetical protein